MLDGEVHKIFRLVSDYLLQQLAEYVVNVILLQILLDLFAELDLLFPIHKLQLSRAITV